MWSRVGGANFYFKATNLFFEAYIYTLYSELFSSI